MADMGIGLLSSWLRDIRFHKASPHVRPGRVLDFACGIGLFARLCPSEGYLGVDLDAESVEIAGKSFPGHAFATAVPEGSAPFETIVMLAFVEHLPEPEKFLSGIIAKHLAPGGRLVLTTPHPAGEGIYNVLSRLGICSRSANDQHYVLFDRRGLGRLASGLGLEMTHYGRFLFGLNQIAVFEKPT